MIKVWTHGQGGILPDTASDCFTSDGKSHLMTRQTTWLAQQYPLQRLRSTALLPASLKLAVLLPQPA